MAVHTYKYMVARTLLASYGDISFLSRNKIPTAICNTFLRRINGRLLVGPHEVPPLMATANGCSVPSLCEPSATDG